MSKELKPCPYCGGEASHRAYKDAYKSERHNVECTMCGAEAGYGDATGGLSWTTKEAAYKQWNARADSGTKRQAIKELLALHKQDRAKVNSQCDTLINMSTIDKYLEGLE